MARSASSAPESAPTPAKAAKAAKTPTAPEKEPGRLKQLWLVFTMTRRHEPTIVWWLLLALIVPIAVAIVLNVLVFNDNLIGSILTVIAGVLLGVLAVLIVLGRRAEKAAYSQIEGQPGAVGAVLKSALRRSWQGSELPIAISPRTQDAVYRAVGKGGVALIGEGPLSRVRPMLEKERANVHRILPNVPVTLLHVGPDEGAVQLHRIYPTLARLKRALSRAEVTAVANRLASLQRNPVAIPKGIDPLKARMPRPR